MKRTILTLSFALISLFAYAQTERKDSVAVKIVPTEEAKPENRIETSVQNSSFGTFYEPDFKDFFQSRCFVKALRDYRSEFSLEERPLEINTNAMPTMPEPFSIPNLAMYSTHDGMFGLADIRRDNFAYTFSAGNWTFTAMASGEKYKFQNTTFDNFLLGGSATYSLSPHWSLTAFGQYSTGRYFHSLAAYPYISQSQFGGTLNYHGEHFGMRLGARQYYDPLRRQWQTEPIIAPQFKIGRLPVEVDFGPLARKILERAILGNRNDGPIIMPPGR